MNPILYDQTEQNFTTNGVGIIGDAISCKVKTTLNGVYEIELKYPVTGQFYGNIVNNAYIKAVPGDGMTPQIFTIYRITKPINGVVTVYGWHISYRLVYTPCRPFTAGSVTEALQKLKTNAMESCPFDFWTDKSTVATYTQTQPESINSRLKGTSGSILDVYGGEYEFDNFIVKLYNHRGEDNGVKIVYGKNLMDVEQEESIANTYTGIVGMWSGLDDSGNTTVVQTDAIQSAHAADFPFHRTKVVDFSNEYENKPTVQQLTARVERYISDNNIGIPSVSLRVSFMALWQTEEYKSIAPLERVRLGDTVVVLFERLGINTAARVVETVYNTLLDRYDSIQIGSVRSSLAGTITEQALEAEQAVTDAKSELEKAIDKTSKLITGNLGGYIVFRYNADGQPYEMLIMDNPDIEQAQKVWRWNQQGLGYSSTGYNGTYRLGMTIDGQIVADFINTGTLTANLIKAGILTDVAGKFSLNMQTGELHMSNGTFNGTIKLGGGDGRNGELYLYGENGNLIYQLDKTNGLQSFGKFNQRTYTTCYAKNEHITSGGLGIDLINAITYYRDDLSADDPYAYIGILGNDGYLHLYSQRGIVLKAESLSGSADISISNGSLSMASSDDTYIGAGGDVNINADQNVYINNAHCGNGASGTLTDGWGTRWTFEDGILTGIS